MRLTHSETPKHTHLLHYLRVLSKRRVTVMVILALAAGLGVIFSILSIPQYEAHAQLLIEVERPQVIVFDDKKRDDAVDYQETQVKILESRTLAARTIEHLKAWEHPEFGGGTAPEAASEVATITSGVREWFAALPARFSKSPTYTGGALAQPNVLNLDATVGREESASQTRAIDRFVRKLKTSLVGGSRIVQLRFTSADPRLAAAALNSLTAQYIEQNQEFKKGASVESAEWLGQQLEAHRKQLQDSQMTLQRYRERTVNTGSAEAGASLQRRLEHLNAALTQARTVRMQKESLAQRVEAVRGDAADLIRLPPIATSPGMESLRREVTDLRQQDVELAQTMGERHPERVKLRLAIEAAERRRDDELIRLTDLIRSEYQVAQSEEADLSAAVEALRRDEVAVSAHQIEYDGLVRAATTDQQIFETLLQRAKETSVTTQMVASNIRVVDAATVPLAPTSPNRRVDLMLSLFFGSILAVAIAFLAEYMDKSIKSPDEVRSELGLACLGIVPLVTRGPEVLNVANGVPEAFTEAFRTVRTNMLLASRGEGVRTVLVTSSGPNEGKTVVASNLAILLAQTGQSVVLVDADLRRPSVHGIFGLSREPGLSDLAAGRLKPSRTIHASSIPGLWLVPSGPLPPNPSEILSSERFEKFIKVLGRTFDWVIVDSAPVMAVTDATLVARVVSGVLFVVAAEQSSTTVAQKAVEQLEVAQPRFVGAVINKVNLHRNAFYYSDYYRREYSRYYTGSSDRDQKDAEDKKPRGGHKRPSVFGDDGPLTAAPSVTSTTVAPAASRWNMTSRRLRRLRSQTRA